MTRASSTPKRSRKGDSTAIDFQEILQAMKPFAKFQEAGWQGTCWENGDYQPVVMVRYKDGEMTETVIRVGDFERILRAYKMAGGK